MRRRCVISKKNALRIIAERFLYLQIVDCLLFEKVLNGIVRHHLFLESVSSGFGRFHNLYDLAVGAAFTLLE